MSKEKIEEKCEIIDSKETNKRGAESLIPNAKQYVIGSKIFIMCLCFMFIIYVVNIFTGGEYTETILETLKTLCFTISGYLFGRSKTN